MSFIPCSPTLEWLGRSNAQETSVPLEWIIPPIRQHNIRVGILFKQRLLRVCSGTSYLGQWWTGLTTA
jgi:hypothetical protein